MGVQTVKKVPSPTPPVEARQAVKDLLLRSAAFSKLPAETQQQIAKDTAEIAGYLAQPEGIPGNTLPTAGALADDDPNRLHKSYQENLKQVRQAGKFKAQAAREGAEVAGVLLQKINFPDFCAKLIQGVFHAIVQSSIEQMEAYGKLVASVAQTLNQFRDDNVSDNQGRDHLVDQFPDLFQLGTADGDDFFSGPGSGQPRVRLKDGVDEDAALDRVNSRLPTPVKSLDLSDDENENALVQSARTQLATSRQQLLATMVLMGINRIVITDGKIQAKIMYDFQARDSSKMQRSATAMDYATDSSGNVQTTSSSQIDTEANRGESSYSKSDGSEDRQTGAYYTKGTYKYSQQPIITAMSTASEVSESALQTKAQLSGTVDINFKSDYLPLEKMADSFQIGMIQNAAKPGRGAAAASGAAPATGAAPGAGGATPPPATGSGAPAAQPRA
jgi:hypothetical protein